MSIVQTSKLLHLPVVLLRDIFEENGLAAIFNLRLVSRACRLESSFLFFRSVALTDSSHVAKTMSLDLVKRLSNDHDAVSRYMRHLQVGPFRDEKWFSLDIILPALESIIPGARHLQSLTWKTNIPIIAEHLQAFQKHHSHAKLYVINHDRGFNPIARDLLSSPRLHTLDTPILYRDRWGSLQSQLHIVKRCLMQGNSIKVLRLRFKDVTSTSPWMDDDFQDWQGASQGPCNFHWQNGDYLPALEELSVNPECYLFTSDDCAMWAKVMDWSNLRRLELYQGAPRHLLLALTNKVPNLEYLQCGINSTATWHPLDTGLHILTDFIASITALQEITFRTTKYSDLMDTLTIVLQRHGKTLRRLDLSCPSFDSKQWLPNQYVQVLKQVPELETFRVELNNTTATGRWDGETKKLVRWQKYETLAWTKRLRPAEDRPFFIRDDGLDLRGI
ncbi:hypothetical protein BDV96DRAFT_505458 [Lophiotrema nucula]|uniref:F-box domain-containing protein n=1 Tax=Lophiotrema nucula TaxID=690887 RepID=A0A6A5YLE3_9PLEO|nr:hypothetical protein BDV96DRAFT_505458 [Lophiotrema nucula]